MTVDELAAKLAQVDERCLGNTYRLNNLEAQIDAVNRLATSVEVLVTEQKHQTETINEIKSDVANLDKKVEALEQKPAKKWDGLVEKVVWALIAAVIGFALAQIGLG